MSGLPVRTIQRMRVGKSVPELVTVFRCLCAASGVEPSPSPFINAQEAERCQAGNEPDGANRAGGYAA